MNEGVGSTTIIVIIMVFIAFVSAYLAYNVNYTKAFRMKNKIISLYEEYNGDCTSEKKNGETESCIQRIQSYKNEIGYPSGAIDCENNIYRPELENQIANNYRNDGFCVYRVKADNRSGSGDVVDPNAEAYYYRAVTRVDIRIPIVQNVLNLRILNVTGDTSMFKKKKD